MDSAVRVRFPGQILGTSSDRQGQVFTGCCPNRFHASASSAWSGKLYDFSEAPRRKLRGIKIQKKLSCFVFFDKINGKKTSSGLISFPDVALR